MRKSEFYNDYKKARDKAWDILIKYNVSTLPVGMLNLCSQMGIYAASYEKAYKTIKAHDFEAHATNNDGFATIINGYYFIFYDSTVQPRERLRFTLAHELGHIVLEHLFQENVSCRSGVTVWNRGEVTEPNDFEKAANIFASRLLAPACVLWALNVHTPKEIAELCGLSNSASKVRAERMALLYQREQEWLEKYNKSCFGLSPNEKTVLKQFHDFIRGIKK